MSEFAMRLFEVFEFTLKLIIIFIGPAIRVILDFRRFKARYGKRTFFQYHFRHGRSETETEDPTPLFMLKTAGMLIWMGYFTILFFP